jgi:DDE family transposase
VNEVRAECDPSQPAPAPRAKPGPKPRPRIRGEDLFGDKYILTLQKHLIRLHAAHPHPNRTLFFDQVAVAYLLAFFSPVISSLRTLDDASQTLQMQENTGGGRIPRSTLSDANAVFDPALLEPIIEELRARVPNLPQTDPQLNQILHRVRAADSSLFTVPATVAWALKQRRANQKKLASVRLNLQWAVAAGVPEGVCISGADTSEAETLMREIDPGTIYVMDRGYVNFLLISRILGSCADLVLRLKNNNLFTVRQERKLSDEDRKAGVVSDKIGHLTGTATCPAPGAMLREVVILDPARPDHPVRLLTSILDVPAHVIGQIYRARWQIELFFRWIKVHAHFEHLISHSQKGVTTGFYIAIIAVLLMYIRTGRPVSKYAHSMLGLVAAGQATMEQVLPILERRERECELDRKRRERKKAEKAGK